MWCKSMNIIANGTNAGESAATRTKETLPETCIIDLHEKFDASSSQFLAPKHLSTQFVSRARQFLLRARNLYQKKLVSHWLTHVQVSCTRRLIPVSGTSFFGVCSWHNGRALHLSVVCFGWTVHPRAKVTIDSLQQVVYKKLIGTKMNDLDFCLEVV